MTEGGSLRAHGRGYEGNCACSGELLCESR